MRYISLLLITLFLASCGNQKMRFVRTTQTKQKVVDVAEIPALKKSTNSISQDETQVNEGENRLSTEHPESPKDLPSSEQQLQDIELSSAPLPKTTQDSTIVTPEEADAITKEALRAEKLGNWSLVLSILTYVLVILAGLAFLFAFGANYSPVFIIAGFTSLILALGSIVTGFVLGVLSLTAPYNTPSGRRRAIAGVIIASLGILLLLLNIALSF